MTCFTNKDDLGHTNGTQATPARSNESTGRTHAHIKINLLTYGLHFIRTGRD